MPGVQIPSDWDGEAWSCVRVQWPDSPQYRALLRGALSQLMRGRYWDGQTGSVIGAQNVGKAVWAANAGLSPCAGDGNGGDAVQIFNLLAEWRYVVPHNTSPYPLQTQGMQVWTSNSVSIPGLPGEWELTYLDPDAGWSP